MASFVIHNIAGERFLSILEEEYGIKLSEEEKNTFLMANLIPDSSKLTPPAKDADPSVIKAHRANVQNEKVSTHFRSTEDRNLCIQAPQLEKFTEKYGDSIPSNIAYLGYLFHLYTDKTFFEDLFTKTFATLDENMQPTIYSDKTKYMRVNKNGQLYTIAEFWDSKSPKSIYNDYTVMNRLLLEHYGCTFDVEGLTAAAENFENPGIDEVDFSNITKVINKTSSFIRESYEAPNTTLNIFDDQQVIDFIDETAQGFISRYQSLLPQAEDSKTYQKCMVTTANKKEGEN